MNHPDISTIIRDIAAKIDSGMVVRLDVATGEIECAVPEESGPNEDAQPEPEVEAAAPEDNMVEFMPIDFEDEYEMMEYFISDTVREDTRLYKRLQSAIKSSDPISAFKREIALCKGEKQWQKYRDDALFSMVVSEIVETIGMPFVKTYKLNSATIRLIAESTAAGHYCYVSGKKVIISQVVYQPDADYSEDEYQELDTFYTIKEWALMRAEEQMFYHEMGGGYVREPCRNDGELSDEDFIRAEEEEIRKGLKWAQDEKEEFEDFCAAQNAEEDPWDAFLKRMGANNETASSIGTQEEQKKIYPDGKFPMPGRPDGRFTDENPWWSAIRPCDN